MGRTIYLFILAGLFAVFVSSGCNNNRTDDRDRGRSLATVDNPDNSLNYFFDTDRGNRMWIASTSVRNYRPETGQRIIADFFVLLKLDEGADHNYDVHLNNVFEVLTKDIVEINEENDEELGNDPVRNAVMWIAGDWLNVEFIFRGHNRTHYINVGQLAGTEPSVEGEIDLQFRHNANGDTERRDLWGIASFNLVPLRQDGVDEVKINVWANIAGIEGGKTFELTYTYGTEEAVGGDEFSFKDLEWADVN